MARLKKKMMCGTSRRLNAMVKIVLPLAVPALIFGAGAVDAVEQGLSASGHHSLLGALLIATAMGVPWATAAALRISTE